MGLCTNMVRQPLLPLEEPHVSRLQMVLETTGALEFGAKDEAESAGGGGSKRSTAHLSIVPPTASTRS
jgi:hypothetical protein